MGLFLCCVTSGLYRAPGTRCSPWLNPSGAGPVGSLGGPDRFSSGGLIPSLGAAGWQYLVLYRGGWICQNKSVSFHSRLIQKPIDIEMSKHIDWQMLWGKALPLPFQILDGTRSKLTVRFDLKWYTSWHLFNRCAKVSSTNILRWCLGPPREHRESQHAPTARDCGNFLSICPCRFDGPFDRWTGGTLALIWDVMISHMFSLKIPSILLYAVFSWECASTLLYLRGFLI